MTSPKPMSRNVMPEAPEQITVRPILCTLLGWLACGVLLADEPPELQADGAEKRFLSVQEGVFTDAQAERGRAVFEHYCAECHFPLEYSRGYLNGWARQPVYALFERVSTTMPYLEPGSLSDEHYIDVVALLLSLNEVPSGETELPADADRLRDIVLEGPFR